MAALPALQALKLGKPSRQTWGLYLQVLSSLFISLMALVAKIAGNIGLPVFEIVLARSLVLLGMSAGLLWRQKDPQAWPWRSERRALLVLRGCLGFGAVSSLYWAVQLLPLADTAVLAFLAPVFVAVLAPLVLRERASRGVALAMPLCIAGVVLVSQPTFLFGRGTAALSALGVAVGISQAVFSAAAKLTIRSLGSTESVSSIIFAMAAVSTLGSGTLCALLPRHFVVPASAAAWALLLATGVLGCGVQLLATAALKLSKAAPVLAMSYVSVVWGLLFDQLFFRHSPSALGLLGAALVCGSSLIVIFYEQRSAASSSSGSSAENSTRDSTALAMAVKAKQSGALEVAVAAHGSQQQRWLGTDVGSGSLNTSRHSGSTGRLLELAETGGQHRGGEEEEEEGEQDGGEERQPLVGAR